MERTFTATEFAVALEKFFEGCVKISNEHRAKHYPNVNSAKWEIRNGSKRRYALLVRDGSAHAFVDKTNGDVLKPASWKAPAKGARGNIFDADGGLGRMGPYGPAYNR